MFNRRVAAPCMALLLAVALLAAGLLSAGCGSSDPQSAVQKYFSAWQKGDWGAFKSSVVPQELTQDQEALAKEKFAQVKVKVDGLKMRTSLDEKDKNKAVVVLTDGRITYSAKILGKNQTEVQDMKKVQEALRTFNVVRVNGVWYVDTKLG